MRAAGAHVVAAADGEDARLKVERRSRDFYWYSPVLKERLAGRVGDALVLARSEADVVAAPRRARDTACP